MRTHFVAEEAEATVVEELSNLVPTNPFATASYFESCRQIGHATWVLGLRDADSVLDCGCAALLKTGRKNRILTIPSLPPVGANSPFWNGLRGFCREHGVSKLVLDTFASLPGVEIPEISPDCSRRHRIEFLMDLTVDPIPKLSSNQIRNLKKAKKAGLVLRRTRSTEAMVVHVALMNQSMNRRRERGEDVPEIGPSRAQAAYLRTGAGELFQACRCETVLSSVLVLLAPKGGYFQSSGTSPEGMTVGASQFLIVQIANILRAEGASTFNLGGAEDGSSLAMYKKGFGASQVYLPAASCDIRTTSLRRVLGGVARIRAGTKRLLQPIIPRVSRLCVYATDTASPCPPELPSGVEFRALTPEDLRTLSVGDSAFQARQLERLQRFGASYAYAVFADGQIAHISWLLPSAAMKCDVPRVLKPRADEAEITACETLPEFRGRGLYGVAVGNLIEVAKRQGIRRVFMKTGINNRTSQRGIEKAGLKCVGSVVLIGMPTFGDVVFWRRLRRTRAEQLEEGEALVNHGNASSVSVTRNRQTPWM